MLLQGNLRISFNENVSEVEIGEINTDRNVKNLMMEEKIRSFGEFSGDISMVLMMLLKDNEKFKSLIQSGFEEIEIRINDLSEKIEAEKKERETEIANIHQALNAHNYEIEALRNKVTETKLSEATQKATDERMSEVESHVDDINGRLNLRYVFKNYAD